MPPYDDAFIASYDDDAEVPPFDAPAPAPVAAPAPAPDLGEAADGDAPVDPKEVLQNIWGNVTFK